MLSGDREHFSFEAASVCWKPMGKETLLAFGGVTLLVGFLYFAWIDMSLAVEDVQSSRVVKSAGEVVSCQASRFAFERSILAWSISNPGRRPTFKALKTSGLEPPTCPQGGHIQLKGQKLVCSLH